MKRECLLGALLVLACVLPCYSFCDDPTGPSYLFWVWESLDRAADATDLCAGVTWGGQCAAKIDSALLTNNSQVWRTEEGLHIRTERDSLVLLKDHHCDCESALKHLYVGMVSDLRSHVVYAGQYEGRYYVLVNAASGDTTQLQSFPVVSPDGQRFVTASVDIETGDSANELQIWRVTASGPQLEWNMHPGWDLKHPNPAVLGWGPIRPRWRDQITVSISAYAYMEFNEKHQDGGGVPRHQIAPVS